MRHFYLLIFLVCLTSSLQAQTAMNVANNSSSFYINDTDCDNDDPFDGIIWPCNFETISCKVLSNPSVSGEPIIKSSNYNQIKVSYEDLSPLEYSADCKKILRKWTVTDIRRKGQNAGNGVWEYIQELKVLKSNPPIFVSETRDKQFCVYKNDCSTDLINLKAEAVDECSPDSPIEYYYEIDLHNDGTLDFNGGTNDASDIFPFGKHKITWYAKNGCGEIAHCEYIFKVKDCSPPSSNCLNGLMVELESASGEVTLQAKDFDQGSFDNCEIEEFRVASPSKGDGQTSPPSDEAKSLTFDCSAKGVNSVDLWVKDNNGNWSYCTTYVIIGDKDFNCEKGVAREKTLAQKIDRFTEEVPLEIEKMYIPNDEIQQSEDERFKIYPSQPNPFVAETKISFDLDTKTKMTFTIQDASGNIVKIIEKEFLAGANEIMLKKEDFRSAGIFFFTLQSKTHKATGKIVLIQR